MTAGTLPGRSLFTHSEQASSLDPHMKSGSHKKSHACVLVCGCIWDVSPPQIICYKTLQTIINVRLPPQATTGTSIDPMVRMRERTCHPGSESRACWQGVLISYPPSHPPFTSPHLASILSVARSSALVGPTLRSVMGHPLSCTPLEETPNVRRIAHLPSAIL